MDDENAWEQWHEQTGRINEMFVPAATEPVSTGKQEDSQKPSSSGTLGAEAGWYIGINPVNI